MRVCRCVATDGRAPGTRVKAEGNFRQGSERFSYVTALSRMRPARLSSRQSAPARACVHANARGEKCVSCSDDGDGSFELLAAESNARPSQLVAQLARVDARSVLVWRARFLHVRRACQHGEPAFPCAHETRAAAKSPETTLRFFPGRSGSGVSLKKHRKTCPSVRSVYTHSYCINAQATPCQT